MSFFVFTVHPGFIEWLLNECAMCGTMCGEFNSVVSLKKFLLGSFMFYLEIAFLAVFLYGLDKGLYFPF